MDVIKAKCIRYISYDMKDDDCLYIGKEYYIEPYINDVGDICYRVYDGKNNKVLVRLTKIGMERHFTMSPIRNSVIDKILND